MIEVVSKNNIDDVLPLIRTYQEFYNVAEILDSENKKFSLNLANQTLMDASLFIDITAQL